MSDNNMEVFQKEAYISLIKGKGIRGSTEAAKKAFEAVGCKQIATYVLMGQYDVLTD